MILLAVTMAAGVVAGFLRGGRLRNLVDVRLRHVPLLAVAALGQVLVTAGLAGGDPVATRLLLACAHAAVLAFVWGNRQLPGMVAVALGSAANAVVMVANAAMPVSGRALRAAGAETADVRGARHVLAESVDGGARLAWLGDVVPLPFLSTVVSPGDLLLGVGIAVLLAALMGRRRRAHARVARRRART